MLTAGKEVFCTRHRRTVQHPCACPGKYTYEIGGRIRGPHSCTALRSAAIQVQKSHPEIFSKQQLIVGVLYQDIPGFLNTQKVKRSV